MRKIREALRLHAGGLSTRKIAASLGVGQSTASDYLKRVERAGLSWPLAAEMTDAALEALLFHPIGGPSRLVEAQPDPGSRSWGMREERSAVCRWIFDADLGRVPKRRPVCASAQ